MFYITENKNQEYMYLIHKSFTSVEAAKAHIDKVISYGVWSYKSRWFMVDGLWHCQLKAFPNIIVDHWIKPVF